jgi:hypothetical protein
MAAARSTPLIACQAGSFPQNPVVCAPNADVEGPAIGLRTRWDDIRHNQAEYAAEHFALYGTAMSDMQYPVEDLSHKAGA